MLPVEVRFLFGPRRHSLPKFDDHSKMHSSRQEHAASRKSRSCHMEGFLGFVTREQREYYSHAGQLRARTQNHKGPTHTVHVDPGASQGVDKMHLSGFALTQHSPPGIEQQPAQLLHGINHTRA